MTGCSVGCNIGSGSTHFFIIIMKWMNKGRHKPARRTKLKRRRPYTPNATSGQIVRSPEVKCVDIEFGTGTISSAGFALALNSINTGAEIYQRVGRQIAMVSLEFRGYGVLSGNAFAPDFVRLAFVYDRSPDGATASFNDVFTNVDNTGGVTHDSLVFPDQGNRDRFKILADLQFPIVPLTGIAPSALQGQDVEFNIHRYIKLHGLEARYAASATVPQTGQILVVAKGQNAAGSAQMNLVLGCRLSYTDV